MTIDCHGHFTTAPKELGEWRRRQLDSGATSASKPEIPDADIRAAIDEGQLKKQRERGLDVTLFSPIAGQMGHHLGTAEQSVQWARVANDLIARVCALYPTQFVGVCQLPQSPAHGLAESIRELERCVTELGFVGCNLNPDPSGGYWTGPPLTDRSFYPLYEKLCELAVPAMVHVSGSCNPCFHHTGAHYLNGDTTAFMQFVVSPQLFTDFPTLKFVIPHGGGAVPYHWGRYRGLAADLGIPSLDETLLNNIFFDTCVYHQAGIDLLLEVIPTKNVIFGSEMIGAVKSIDPQTGYFFDDTKRYVESSSRIDADQRRAVLGENVFHVYPRLRERLAAQLR